MYTKDFPNNKGTIKKPKDMRGKYCLWPFINIDIHSNHGVRCCCSSWMPEWIGDLSQKTIMEIWNDEKIQKIRKSILDGSYSFCDWHQCSFYSNDEYYLYTLDELKNPEGMGQSQVIWINKHKPWIQYILEGKTVVDIPPANYNLAYDESCNLACPSCRNATSAFVSGPEYEKRLAIHKKVVKEVEENDFANVGRFNISGSGEAFFSKIFTDFLFNFDGKKFPKLEINLQTNGVLFTPEAWDKMHKIHENINQVIISLDASCEETYRQIRVNGSYTKLLKNIEFLAGLHKKGIPRVLMLAFVVQKKNYLEMIDAIKIAKSFGANRFIFNLLTDWSTWDPEVYEENAIWKSYHPEFERFKEILKDPIFDDPIVDLGNMTDYRK